MTKEPIIIKLQIEENLDEKIIKEKGNTKCIFYSDDVCRSGDKTRDCLNCARVNYRSLYKLNWDNQDRLFEQLKEKNQLMHEYIDWCDKLKAENEELKEKYDKLQYSYFQATKESPTATKINAKFNKYEQALQEIKEIAEAEIECKTYEIENDCFNKTRCKALNEHIDFTKQILQKCEVLND